MAMETIAMLKARSDIYPEVPPDRQTQQDTHSILLTCWWMTILSLVIITVRVCGRYVRIKQLFPEDKVMMASMVPLVTRMAFVHVILIWGTNNTTTTTTTGISREEIGHREIGSRLVLGARIFYAIFIWMAKFTIFAFLKRVASMIWSRSLQFFLRFLSYFLASTLLAVVIATLSECQPFHNYWQVTPDPGPHCRAGYAHLLTMGICDIITDLLLVAYPVPVILRSLLPAKRKVSLVPPFALSLILVAITAFRIPTVIQRSGSQSYRSLLASLEIIAATAISNAVVIASFVRDKGAKRPKFEREEGYADVNDSMFRSSSRRATITRFQWGSDSDLARDLGFRLDPVLCSSSVGHAADPAQAITHAQQQSFTAGTGTLDPNWSFEPRRREGDEEVGPLDDDSIVGISPTHTRKNSVAPLIPPSFGPPLSFPSPPPRSASSSEPRRRSIFDIDGLLGYLDSLERSRQPPSREIDDWKW